MIDESTQTELEVRPDSAAASEAAPTRWDVSASGSAAGPTDESAEPRNDEAAPVAAQTTRERGGLFLAIVSALLLPILIVVAIAISQTDGGSNVDAGNDASSITPSTGLGELGINDDPVSDAGEQIADGPSSDGSIQPEVQGIVEETGEPAETDDPAVDGASGTTTLSPSDGRADVDADDASGEGAGAAAVIGAATPSEPVDAGTPSTTAAPATTNAPSTTSPATTVGPTTSVSPPTTTAPATTAAPTVTLKPTLPAGEQDADLLPDGAGASPFTARLEIGQLGDTYVRFRFTTRNTTTYRAVILASGRVVATRGGTAIAGERVNESVDGLSPGRNYSVQIVLNGPPAFTASPVVFRTSGGNADPIDVDVELLELRVVDRQATRIEFRYESNVCANGSFVIRQRGGDIVGSNSGQAQGCTTRHLGIPGFWTPALRPNTTYDITVTVEASGAGQGGGNNATQTITVTTTS